MGHPTPLGGLSWWYLECPGFPWGLVPLGAGAPGGCPGLGAEWESLVSPSSISVPQEAAHERMMGRRQACEAQTPGPLRRHRSLTAHSLLPLAEKQRRVLRNLRRLEGLGLVSASDGYQGLVDELAKVTA